MPDAPRFRPRPPPPPNVVLIGFMGSGKSTVGRHLAGKLGLHFVDTDEEIERLAGKSIPAIFREVGEPGFRDLETRVLQQLAAQRSLVIATGGGIVLREANRELLQRIGFVVWLAADAATTFRRVSKSRDRPLLRTPNPRETIESLLVERTPLYESCCDLKVETSHLTSEEIAYGIKESLPPLAAPSEPSR